MLLIEPAEPSEVVEVARLATEAHLDVDSEAFHRACTHDTCMVARESRSGRILGFAVVARDAPCEGHILAIAVDRLHRGEGIGSALLRGVGDAMARIGTYHLSLEVRRDNAAAQDFYARNGFHREGFHPNAYADGQDAVCYGKPLR